MRAVLSPAQGCSCRNGLWKCAQMFKPPGHVEQNKKVWPHVAHVWLEYGKGVTLKSQDGCDDVICCGGWGRGFWEVKKCFIDANKLLRFAFPFCKEIVQRSGNFSCYNA